MNKQTTFLWGKHFPSTCSLSTKNIFSNIFYNNPNMSFVHTFPMELEYPIYYFYHLIHFITTLLSCMQNMRNLA